VAHKASYVGGKASCFLCCGVKANFGVRGKI